MWIISGSRAASATSMARLQHDHVVVRGNAARQPGLHADDPLPLPRHGGLGLLDIGLLHAIEELAFAAGVVPEPADVQQDAHAVRRGLRNANQLVDVVGAP